MLTKKFWKDAAERAMKTFGQALVVAWPVSAAVQSAADFQWQSAGQQFASMFIMAAGASVLSIITSLASYKFGTPGTASTVVDVDYAG